MLQMVTFLSTYSPERGQCELLTLRKQFTGSVRSEPFTELLTYVATVWAVVYSDLNRNHDRQLDVGRFVDRWWGREGTGWMQAVSTHLKSWPVQEPGTMANEPIFGGGWHSQSQMRSGIPGRNNVQPHKGCLNKLRRGICRLWRTVEMCLGKFRWRSRQEKCYLGRSENRKRQ